MYLVCEKDGINQISWEKHIRSKRKNKYEFNFFLKKKTFYVDKINDFVSLSKSTSKFQMETSIFQCKYWFSRKKTLVWSTFFAADDVIINKGNMGKSTWK